MSIEAPTSTRQSQLYLKERYLLNQGSSTKKTYHLSFQWSSPLSYTVGDSIALFPHNSRECVESLLIALRATGEESLTDPKTGTIWTLRKWLTQKANLQEISPALAQRWHERNSLPLPEEADPLDCAIQGLLTKEDLPTLLRPLLPRFYSIASSPTQFPHEVHITVACKTYLRRGILQYGVSSHFLCHQVDPSTPITCYIQPSRGFTLPSDLATPLMLIGPGTGIAPFRAFLQERILQKASGAHWLFFGERHQAFDFYYEDFWRALETEGRLRLSLAFSRDGPNKIYVQHRLYEEKREVWQWMQKGCHIYICGDANHMAKSVGSTLQQILQEEGEMSADEAKHFYKRLRKAGRLLLDVY